jgi:molybdate transport system regulatory protein
VRTKVWLERDGIFVVGDGGLRLLLEVEARGSLLAAVRQVGWSYRHAWEYLRRAEQVLECPLVTSRPGKGRRRGTVLTAEGRRLLTLLRDARSRLDRSVGTTGPTREEVAARAAVRRGPATDSWEPRRPVSWIPHGCPRPSRPSTVARS